MISVVSTAQAAAATVAMPAHQPGDIIIVSVRRANNTAATIPTASGTVPNYVRPAALTGAGTNTLAQTTVWFQATASNHTTGTFTNGNHIVIIVLRSDNPLADFTIGAVVNANGNNDTTQAWPALTLTYRDGTSMGVRIGSRGASGHANLGSPPAAGWTNRINSPATGAFFLSGHTRGELDANIPADTVSGLTQAAWRAHTIEVIEHVPIVIPDPPSNVVVTPGVRSARVEWTPGDAGNGVIAQHTVTPRIQGTAQTPVVVPMPDTSVVVTGLEERVQYTFTVTATNEVGTSAPSAPSRVITPLPETPARGWDGEDWQGATTRGWTGVDWRRYKVWTGERWRGF